MPVFIFCQPNGGANGYDCFAPDHACVGLNCPPFVFLRALTLPAGFFDAPQCSVPPPITPTPTVTPGPPTGTSVLTWNVSDGCADGRGLRVRFFDVDNNLVWPDASHVWLLDPGGQASFPLRCQTGAKICYGARQDPEGTFFWGVDTDGQSACDNCCSPCQDGTRGVNLVCN